MTGSRLVVPVAFWIGLTAALLALWLSGQAGDAWQAVRDARLLPLLAVLGCGMLLPVIHAWRWRVVMRALDSDVPLALATDLTVSASLVNYASPGYLGAPAKAFLANRAANVPWSRSLLSMAFEQGLDFLVLLLASVATALILGPDRLGQLLPDARWAVQLAIVGAAVLVGVVTLTVLRARVRRTLARIVDAFRHLGDRVTWPHVAVLTLAYWLVQVAVVALLLAALRLPLTLRTVLALATIPLLAGQVAPLPGGIGAREAAIVALAGATGIGTAALLGLAVLQRVLLVAALPLSLGALRVARVSRVGRVSMR